MPDQGNEDNQQLIKEKAELMEKYSNKIIWDPNICLD